jgi:hypothetical protein
MSNTVDWSDFMTLSERERDALRAIYLETIKAERDANIRNWSAMSLVERARYPVIK